MSLNTFIVIVSVLVTYFFLWPSYKRWRSGKSTRSKMIAAFINSGAEHPNVVQARLEAKPTPIGWPGYRTLIGGRTIQCLNCKYYTQEPWHVAKAYCPNCKVFHNPQKVMV